jgi:hypothetical protein
VCRISLPSKARPGRSSTRADRMLSTWQVAEILEQLLGVLEPEALAG